MFVANVKNNPGQANFNCLEVDHYSTLKWQSVRWECKIKLMTKLCKVSALIVTGLKHAKPQG